MRTLVESLKRMYETGKPVKITEEQLRARVEKGIITEEEYEYIVGKPEEAEEELPEESIDETEKAATSESESYVSEDVTQEETDTDDTEVNETEVSETEESEK